MISNFQSNILDVFTIMEPEHESNTTAVPTVDVLKQVAVSISREPVYKSNVAMFLLYICSNKTYVVINRHW